MTKAANADLTHDLKPRRLPPLQNYKPVTAACPSSAPFSSSSPSSSYRLLLKPPTTLPTVSSSASFSSLLSDPGPLRLSTKSRLLVCQAEAQGRAGPHWLLFRSSEWHYWDPNLAVCMWPGNRLTPVPIACRLEETRRVDGGGLRQLLLLDQSFSRGNAESTYLVWSLYLKDQCLTFQRQLLS